MGLMRVVEVEEEGRSLDTMSLESSLLVVAVVGHLPFLARILFSEDDHHPPPLIVTRQHHHQRKAILSADLHATETSDTI